MKHYSLCVVCIFFSMLVFGQSNNPFAQKGEDLVNTIALITKDYQSNLIRDLNTTTIEYYTKKAGLKTSMSVEATAAIIKASKSKNVNFNSLLQQSTFSPTAQQLIKDIISNPTNMSNEAFREFLVNKNTDIQASNMLKEEKEALLTLSAMVYTIKDPRKSKELIEGNAKAGGGCYLHLPEGNIPLTSEQCIASGAAIGFIVGFNTCGLWCGIGGAIIGGVVAAVSVS